MFGMLQQPILLAILGRKIMRYWVNLLVVLTFSLVGVSSSFASDSEDPNYFQHLHASDETKSSSTLKWNTIALPDSLEIDTLMVRYAPKSKRKQSDEEIDWTYKGVKEGSIEKEIKDLDSHQEYQWQLELHAVSESGQEYILRSESDSFETKKGVGLLEILVILGALAFFIYGMKVMSEGIQKVAGNRLREILSAMTSNRFAGVGTGFLTTSIIQSSSATTVLVVSFVNAGLLSLRQAIGVIMGANIGTTMTAWILVFVGFKFKMSEYALPLIALGIPMMFNSKTKWRNLGEFLVGFALLFIGLEALKDAVSALDLKNNLAFIEWVRNMNQYGFLSILFFVFLGTIITVIVQSSSAAMALTLTFMASENGLPYEAAAAIVLGENIGTTITANLAALVGNVHAKRAARAHFIFNVFGVLWMLAIFMPFTGLMQDLFGWVSDQSWGSKLAGNQQEVDQYSLALFHTCFNIINTFVLIWFVNLIRNTVIKMVKARGDDDMFTLEYIGNGTLRTPELSLIEAKKEVAKFGKITSRLTGFVKSLLTEHNPKERSRLLKKIAHYEEITDRVEVEVATYLSKVSEGKLTEDSSQKVRSMLSIVNDLERIGDIFFQMSLTIDRKASEKIYFTPEQRENLLEMFVLLEEAFDVMVSNLDDTNEFDLVAARAIEGKINDKRNELRQEHLSNMEEGKYHVKSGMVYSELFSLCEKVGDHIINVSEGADGIS